jgi:hypothetical protein
MKIFVLDIGLGANELPGETKSFAYNSFCGNSRKMSFEEDIKLTSHNISYV